MGPRSLYFTVLIFCANAVLFSLARGASTTSILTKNGAPVFISANSMFGDSEKQLVELVGDVQMTFDGQSLRADRATMDKKNSIIIAEGNMILASTSAYVEGSRAEISYDDSTGWIYDGFVKSGQVLFQGKIIRKVGPDTYEANQASYTACTTCPPAWSFSGSRIDAEIGKYAYIQSAWFYLAGFRFFWLPYLVVPLKSERQSGVLFPSFELDSALDGFNKIIENPFSSLSIPVFWAISRSQDMTVTPKYYKYRGWKTLLNYRHVLNDESGGESNIGGMLRDTVFANSTFKNAAGSDVHPGEEAARRWFVSHEHYYTLPGGFINRAKLNLVSDLRYTRDFPEEMGGAGEPGLENRLSLTKNSELMHSSIEIAYYLNQLKSNPLEGNEDAVHRFPEIKQAGIDRSLLGSRVFLKWDFNYVNFARDDLAFDDVRPGIGSEPKKVVDRNRGRALDGSLSAGSGTFEPDTDIIRSGQRLDLRPELSAPFRIGPYLDVLPSISFRHTQYSFNVAAPANSEFETLPTRQYLRTRFAVRTQFSRVYEREIEVTQDPEEVHAPEPLADGTVPGVFQALQAPEQIKRPEKFKHEIEPEIGILGIPWLQQSRSPFFGDNALSPIFLDGQPVSNSDFYSTKGLQFDYEDRITLRNVVSALITNRFTSKTWNGDIPVYRQFVTIKNGTSYEYDKPDRRDPRENYSDLFTIIDARLENFDSNTSIRYFPYHGVFNTSSRVRFFDKRENFIQLSYSQNYLITENIQEAFSTSSPEENVGLAVGLTSRYAILATEINFKPINYSPFELHFAWKTWSAIINIKPPGNCWGFRTQITNTFGDPKPKVTVGLDYIFGGSS